MRRHEKYSCGVSFYKRCALTAASQPADSGDGRQQKHVALVTVSSVQKWSYVASFAQ